MTPEEKKEKRRAADRAYWAALTPEKREARKARARVYEQAQRAAMTKEEREKRAAYERARWAKRPPEAKERRNIRARAKRAAIKEEKRVMCEQLVKLRNSTR